MEDCKGVNDMVSAFTENITRALDSVAPVKSVTIRSNHRFGLSDSTKELLKKRDSTRRLIKSVDGQEKAVLLNQYKTLRNKVTIQIRKENILYLGFNLLRDCVPVKCTDCWSVG